MNRRKNSALPEGIRRAVDAEVFIFLALFMGFFTLCGVRMGMVFWNRSFTALIQPKVV